MPEARSARRALKARWSTITWSGRTSSRIRCTARAVSTGSHSRSSLRASAWKRRVSTMPRRVAAKKPRSASSSPVGWSSALMVPGLDPRPRRRSTRSKPEASTMPAVADPVATTTRSPACCQADASVMRGKRWDA
ncbi:hypothetical protein BC477_10365 [Clavibacter michiganensis subsp. michiganensis]|uniref:Uncharacterized protein n=1 Tax=Clavibacter michiganensis subsp. michiganensis TaxID=33013 RepID=A0A251XNQ4_CLAMM|nr:hypothetical protein BC477_10365 [Clavibacter michiganensis subsp. michiganensis]OUE05132.1 hypothetical protein CMMCAS07_09285 [Clavibacter michiganensis subsp. michiganensis]